MFNGLDKKYNVFVASINNRLDLPSIEEIHSLFFSYDFRLEEQQVVPSLHNVQADATYLETQRKTPKYPSPHPFYSSSTTTQKWPLQTNHMQFPYQTSNTLTRLLMRPPNQQNSNQ